MTIIRHVLSIEVSYWVDLRRTILSEGGFATLLSSHTGDPGRRWTTQRPKVRHDADKQTTSQSTAGPDLNRPVGRQHK